MGSVSGTLQERPPVQGRHAVRQRLTGLRDSGGPPEVVPGGRQARVLLLLSLHLLRPVEVCYPSTSHLFLLLLLFTPRPDVIVELAWRYNLMDFAMPFLIQTLREFQTKVDKLQQAETLRSEEEAKQEQQPQMMYPDHLMITGPGQIPAPHMAAHPGMMPPPQGLPPQDFGVPPPAQNIWN